MLVVLTERKIVVTDETPTECPCGSKALIDYKRSDDNAMQCMTCDSIVIRESDGTVKRIDIVTGLERV